MLFALPNQDRAMAELLEMEQRRQQKTMTLIPSENHCPQAVLEALGHVVTDKYAEGYPGKRYYSGNDVVDLIELLVQERTKKLFHVPYANVQPYSGSPANFAVLSALCEPGASIMGLDLPSGGHLTHGWKYSMTAHFWKSVPYYVQLDGNMNFDELHALAREHSPSLIWCGGTALPRKIDFEMFAKIADEVGAYLAADISHVAGLILGNVYPSPIPFAHVVTTTTHKTLRGPRGAMIMVTEKGLKKDPELGNKIDHAIIPGLQGGPHMNNIAAIGVALEIASQPDFAEYARRVISNAQALAHALIQKRFTLVSRGTDSHLILLDLTETGIGRGMFFQLALESIGISTNRNTIPHDPSTPFHPSGLRLGTPAVTSRGMKTEEMETIAQWIAQMRDHIASWTLPEEKNEKEKTFAEFRAFLHKDTFFADLRKEVELLCGRFPIPSAR